MTTKRTPARPVTGCRRKPTPKAYYCRVRIDTDGAFHVKVNGVTVKNEKVVRIGPATTPLGVIKLTAAALTAAAVVWYQKYTVTPDGDVVLYGPADRWEDLRDAALLALKCKSRQYSYCGNLEISYEVVGG